MSQNVDFQTVVQALLDDSRAFPPRYLHRFSDISPDDLKAVLQAWPQVSPRRKQSLLEDLEELADADTLLSFEDLARALLFDPVSTVRAQAILLLWECRDAKLAHIYIEMMNEDESQEVRAAAATALGQFVYLGEVEEIPGELHHEVENKLLAATKSAESALVRRRALESLGYSSREDVPGLIEAAYHEGHPDWLESALFAMGRSCDERWEKQVLSKLHDPNEDVRMEAIQAAGELELKSARAALLDLLEDEEDPGGRRPIVWSLSKIGGEGVRSRLEELLDAEEDDDEQEFLEEALDSLSFTEDISPFGLLDLDPGDEKEEEE
jgi:HEAT repeat protein